MTDTQPVAAKLPPLTGLERVQRTRQRKRQDIVFVGIEIMPSERDALIRIGLLDKSDRNDKLAVRDALYAFFESHLETETPLPPS
jgi:hypothetical protein